MTFRIALKIKAKNALLQQFIDEKGWTQADFARAIGVAVATAGQWFNLQTVPGTKALRHKIEKLTGMMIEEIFPAILNNKAFRDQVSRPIVHYQEIDTKYLPFNEIQQINYTVPDIDTFELKDNIESILNTLSPRQQKVIKMRFGLNNSEESTLEEIASELNVTRERVRQIEAKALRGLKHNTRSANLIDFY